MNIVISILFKLPGAGFLVLLGDSPNQHPVRLHLYLDPCPSTGRTRVMCPPQLLEPHTPRFAVSTAPVGLWDPPWESSLLCSGPNSCHVGWVWVPPPTNLRCRSLQPVQGAAVSHRLAGGNNRDQRALGSDPASAKVPAVQPWAGNTLPLTPEGPVLLNLAELTARTINRLFVSYSVHCLSPVSWKLLRGYGQMSAQCLHILGAQEIYVEWRGLCFSPAKWEFCYSHL